MKRQVVPSLAPQRRMKVIFALVTLLIAYGSLYPFDFSSVSGTDLGIKLTALTSLNATTRGDVLGNFVLFLPFGFFGVLAFMREREDAVTMVRLAVTGLMLALVLQVGQLILPTRDPSLFDVALNGLGMAGGMLLARIPELRHLGQGLVFGKTADIPLLLAGIWILSQLLPLVPTLDFSVVKATLKPLILQPALSLPEVALYFAAWLTVLYMLSLSPPRARHAVLLSLLPLAILAFQPFLVDGEITLSEAVGTVAAILAWLATRSRLSPMGLGFGLLAATLASNLLPWEAAAWTKDFHWVPFTGFLEGNMLTNSRTLARKLFLFGSVLWLLRAGGSNWLGATILLVASLGAQEALQLISRRGTPEITDPLIALMVGIWLIWMTDDANLREARDNVGGRALKPASALPERVEPATEAHARNGYLSGLDGLRAIAALSVFGVHFNQTAQLHASIGPFDLERWLANGNTGVALFFVLSGFLLSIPFWRQKHAAGPKIDAKRYFIRRLARILPAYYLCLFGLLAIKFAAGSAPSINNMLSHVVFLYNINDWNILSLNAPFWTLAVEMQFYLLLPLMMLALRRLSPRVAIALVSALAISAYFMNHGLISYLLERNQWPIQVLLIWPFSLYISGPTSFVLTYSTLAHLTFFLIGIVTALVFVISARDRPAFIDSAGASAGDLIFWSCAVAVFLIMATPLDDLLQVPHGRYNWPFVPLLLAAIIFVTPHTTLARRILESRPLRWLGLISYGLYIFHYPIQKLVARVFVEIDLSVIDFWWLFAALSLAASVAVATLSYRLIELPIMRWTRGHGVWQPANIVQAQLSETVLVSTPHSKQFSWQRHSSGSGWTKVDIRLNSNQIETLRQISDMRQVSLSGAARYLLATYIADYDDDSWKSVQLRAKVERDSDNAAGKTCRVNIRRWQYAFLLDTSEQIGGSIEKIFGLIIDHYQIGLSRQRSP